MNLAQRPPAGAAQHIEHARWLAPGCAVAAIYLGLALQIANGFLEPTALALVVSAFALLVGAAVIPRPARFVRLDATLVPVLALAGLVFHLVYLYTSLPGLMPTINMSGTGTVFNERAINGGGTTINVTVSPGAGPFTHTLAPGYSISGNVLGTGNDTFQLGDPVIARILFDTFNVSNIGPAQQYHGFSVFTGIPQMNPELTWMVGVL